MLLIYVSCREMAPNIFIATENTLTLPDQETLKKTFLCHEIHSL